MNKKAFEYTVGCQWFDINMTSLYYNESRIKILMQENDFGNALCKIAAILSEP